MWPPSEEGRKTCQCLSLSAVVTSRETGETPAVSHDTFVSSLHYSCQWPSALGSPVGDKVRDNVVQENLIGYTTEIGNHLHDGLKRTNQRCCCIGVAVISPDKASTSLDILANRPPGKLAIDPGKAIGEKDSNSTSFEELFTRAPGTQPLLETNVTERSKYTSEMTLTGQPVRVEFEIHQRTLEVDASDGITRH
ncbi:2,2-dialkylglycine decarboxylase 1 [Colletotrichum musicola]|uniref:2,2-dialkylglycine decarboxylase 1 n=1 Tax=Colletotrichum musicola TaxID=2175873 RepID=A0A8H6KM42_9PEZI|nr:2,2-dialkylglycine decarboxylase 1 [Colletotrichum musicola]